MLPICIFVRPSDRQLPLRLQKQMCPELPLQVAAPQGSKQQNQRYSRSTPILISWLLSRHTVWVEMCWGDQRSFVRRCEYDWPTMLIKFYESCERTLNSSPRAYYSMAYEIAMRFLPKILSKISIETADHMSTTAHR
jgi:hypothetical protein